MIVAGVVVAVVVVVAVWAWVMYNRMIRAVLGLMAPGRRSRWSWLGVMT